MLTNEYVEVHNGGYYVAGTRIGLDLVTYDFRRGRPAEAIFEAYPSIGSLAKVDQDSASDARGASRTFRAGSGTKDSLARLEDSLSGRCQS